MPGIKLVTEINAPADICFDLSRSNDLHTRSTQHTKEKAIGGVTTGLIGLHETVSWRAKHFGIWLELTSKITDFKRPVFFADEMVKGAFKSFRHEHHFHVQDRKTIMVDDFHFQSPLGLLGKAANQWVLISYMTKFLETRNQHLKKVAESDAWKEILNDPKT